MHRILFRRGVIGLVLAAGLVGSAFAHAATQSPAHGSRTLATSTSGPDTINELPCPNLDNETGLPKPGTVCIGTGDGHPNTTRGGCEVRRTTRMDGRSIPTESSRRSSQR